jgi:hypothetical protein
MEKNIENWLKEELQKGNRLTQKKIREQAKKMSSNKNFQSSKGWF